MAPYNNAPETGTRNSRPAGRGSGAGALVGGALFVGVIAVCALVISYHGIFQFAEHGGHEASPLAHVFPATYALLVLMAFWVSYMLREARPRQRLWVDLILIPALVLVAAAAMLLNNFGLVESVNQRVANVVVAVAPLAALLIAFLLWLTVRAHIRRRRRVSPRPRPAQDRTTVLPARAVAPPVDDVDEDEDQDEEEEEDGALSTRLLRLGAADDTVIRTSPTRRPPVDDDAPPVSRLRAEPEAPEDGDPEKGRPETDAPDAPDESAASVPTVPLPRRSGQGDNPIKRAVQTVPVVPGAARPEPVDVAADEAPATPEHLADEGFQHEPPPGDPTTDEAEAPAPAPERPAPEPWSAPVPPLVGDEEDEPVASVSDLAALSEKLSAPRPAPAAPEEPVVSGPAAPESEAVPESVDGTGGRDESTAASVRAVAAEPVAPAEHGAAGESDAGSPAGHTEPDEPAPHLARIANEGEDEHEEREEHEHEHEGEHEDGTAVVDAPTPDHVPTEPLEPVGPAPSGDLWEPPEEDTGVDPLDDYVPPVWTPPGGSDEEPSHWDGADRADSSDVHEEPSPAPALDHDTGPEVRAAFRIDAPAAPEPSGPVPPPLAQRPASETRTPRAPRASVSMPPGAARPTAEPDPEPSDGPEPEAPTESELRSEGDAGPPTVPDPEPADEPARRPERRSEADPAGDSEPQRPAPRERAPRTPVEKRPMVVKPPRPPMPDFSVEPPSRRVRSEPLRPEE